jgi:hypothetical protein
MNEEFLYYIWKHRLLKGNLRSITGEPLEVVSPGIRNHDAGPDFAEAIMRTATETWAGNVEIHVRTSDWYRHHHDADSGYSNLILHVVFENDLPGKEPSGFPTLEIHPYVPPHLLEHYRKFLMSSDWIPCAADLDEVPRLMVHSMLERAFAQRLERKGDEIRRLTGLNRNNLAEAFYFVLARNFGQKANSHAFEALARSLPLTILARHADNLFQIEALLFGQAGLLSDVADDYQFRLNKEHLFLAKKYGLRPVAAHLWKFMRLRPSGFPTLRIAQFAGLIHQSSGLMSKLLECESAVQMEALLQTVASGYWDNHYRFGEPSPGKPKRAGLDFIHSLIINTVVPFVYLKAGYGGEDGGAARAEEILTGLPPENNVIIRGWSLLGLKPADAFESQALTELKNRFCSLKQCLHCRIGHVLLNRM